MFVSITCDQLMSILKLAIIAPRRSPTTTALYTLLMIPPNIPRLAIHPHVLQSRVRAQRTR